ncbi:MAG: hypothetical protein ACM3IJ_02785 [Candidatus Levyibacteriota bacterium]
MVRVIQKKSGADRFMGFVWSPEFGATIISVLLLFAIPVTILLNSKQQDLQQHASGISKTAVFSVNPPTGTFRVGHEMTVNLLIDGGSQSVDSAKAHVTVSDNLSITSISLTPASQGGCGFIFADDTDKPSIVNPSFNALLPSSTTYHCTLYSMTVMPTAEGTARISLSDAQASTSSGSGDILEHTEDAMYTIIK